MHRPTLRYALVGLLALCTLGAIIFIADERGSAPVATPRRQTAAPTPTPPPMPAPVTFNKAQYSLTDPASIWVVANKQRPLNPLDFAPTDLVAPTVPTRANITATERLLRAEPAAALEKMVAAAAAAGIQLNLQSGYRPYSQQVAVYNNYVRTQGQATADTQSARPGHSEHQTGLAADLGGLSNPSCDIAECYGNTVEGKWLAANAHLYGFVIRYAQGSQSVVGYIYEPWHIRYVGTELATEIYTKGNPPLETFFKLGSAPGY